MSIAYYSIKFIRVEDPKLVFTYYCLLLLILVYIIAFTIIYEKGYQAHDNVFGTSYVKAHGVAYTGAWNHSNFTFYDAIDLMVPPTENNAFFLPTSVVYTANQTRSICDGDHSTGKCTCGANKHCPVDCKPNTYSFSHQVYKTGWCDSTGKFCQVRGWCPLEQDGSPLILNDVGKITLLIKETVAYPKFKISRTNTDDRLGNGRPVPGYNLFSLSDIVSLGGHTSIANIATKGAIITLNSDWTCDLDKPASQCNPKYSWQRVDNSPHTISSGFNFRWASYQGSTRYLRKFIGVRVAIDVTGQGGKFQIVALSTRFGAGLAYLGLAGVICDLILQYCLKDSSKYAAAKAVDVRSELEIMEQVGSPRLSPHKPHKAPSMSDDDMRHEMHGGVRVSYKRSIDNRDSLGLPKMPEPAHSESELGVIRPAGSDASQESAASGHQNEGFMSRPHYSAEETQPAPIDDTKKPVVLSKSLSKKGMSASSGNDLETPLLATGSDGSINRFVDSILAGDDESEML